jgi:hypothetical protein
MASSIAAGFKKMSGSPSSSRSPSSSVSRSSSSHSIDNSKAKKAFRKQIPRKSERELLADYAEFELMNNEMEMGEFEESVSSPTLVVRDVTYVTETQTGLAEVQQEYQESQLSTLASVSQKEPVSYEPVFDANTEVDEMDFMPVDLDEKYRLANLKQQDVKQSADDAMDAPLSFLGVRTEASLPASEESAVKIDASVEPLSIAEIFAMIPGLEYLPGIEHLTQPMVNCMWIEPAELQADVSGEYFSTATTDSDSTAPDELHVGDASMLLDNEEVSLSDSEDVQVSHDVEPKPVCYFDAHTQQEMGFTALNQLLQAQDDEVSPWINRDDEFEQTDDEDADVCELPVGMPSPTQYLPEWAGQTWACKRYGTDCPNHVNRRSEDELLRELYGSDYDHLAEPHAVGYPNEDTEQELSLPSPTSYLPECSPAPIYQESESDDLMQRLRDHLRMHPEETLISGSSSSSSGEAVVVSRPLELLQCLQISVSNMKMSRGVHKWLATRHFPSLPTVAEESSSLSEIDARPPPSPCDSVASIDFTGCQGGVVRPVQDRRESFMDDELDDDEWTDCSYSDSSESVPTPCDSVASIEFIGCHSGVVRPVQNRRTSFLGDELEDDEWTDCSDSVSESSSADSHDTLTSLINLYSHLDDDDSDSESDSESESDSQPTWSSWVDRPTYRRQPISPTLTTPVASFAEEYFTNKIWDADRGLDLDFRYLDGEWIGC